jgi:hypothetical protein
VGQCFVTYLCHEIVTLAVAITETCVLKHRACLLRVCCNLHLSQVRCSTAYVCVCVCVCARACVVQLFQIRFCWKMSQTISFKFPGGPASSRQSIQYFVSKLKTRESLLDQKPARKVSVLTELKLDGTGARLETSSRKIF